MTAADEEAMTGVLACLVGPVLWAGCCGRCWESPGSYRQGLVAVAAVVVVAAGWVWTVESAVYEAAARSLGYQGLLR